MFNKTFLGQPNWKIQKWCKDHADYKGLCFTAECDNSSIVFDSPQGSFQISFTGKYGSWTDYVLKTKVVLEHTGDKAYFKATTQNESLGRKSIVPSKCFDNAQFELTGKIAASGNIQSLLDETCSREDVPDYCYAEIFNDCTSLTKAPELPATTLTMGCYLAMFQNCTSLVKAPELPAETLTDGCYTEMFYGCTSLTYTSQLPATQLANGCYQRMFYGCEHLKISENDTTGTIVLDGIYYRFSDAWCNNMFACTGGTFTGNPVKGKKYYCQLA